MFALACPTPAWAQPVAAVAPGLPPAAEAPDERGAAGIMADVERIVVAEESSGWFLDETHITAIYPVILQTVCRATPAARRLALARAEAEVQQHGEARALFEQGGRVVSAAVSSALSRERRRDALRKAIDGAERGCPFWVTPEVGYDGRQTYRHRFLLSFESGGLLQLRQTEGRWTYGGGGLLRLLGGYGLSGRLSLLTGGEFAGGAMLRTGTANSEFVINYFPAIPLILRVHDVSWHYDFEVAGVSLFQADNARFSFGGRLGFALGVSALRTRFLIPWAGAAVAYERYFESGGRPEQNFIRAGLRIGGVWDP